MSDVIYKEEKLSNLFECKSGNSKYTKGYCNAHSGEYEVYTGSTLQKFASLNTYDYDEPNLSFTTDGEYAGTLKVLRGKYNVGGHRKILVRKDEYLDLDYFSIILQSKFYEKVKKGDVPSVNWNQSLSNIIIKVPVTENGQYDMERQKEIALKYKEIEKQKLILLKKIEYLNTVKVKIEKEKVKYSFEKLNNMVIHKNGKSEYTKEYCKKNSGNIPVYSGNNNSPLAYMNNADYSGEYLTYSKNGCAGYIKILNGYFSINGDRSVIILNKKYSSLNLLYLKYYLEPIFRANIKGRIGVNGKNEYTKLNSTMIKKLNIEVPIPIKENGIYDIEKQKEIAQKIAVIESIKQDLYEKVISLINIRVF